MWFILIVIVRPLLLFMIAEKIAWCTSAGKTFTSCLSACVVLLYDVLIVCVPYLYGVWGRTWNSIVWVPDHCLFILHRTVIP